MTFQPPTIVISTPTIGFSTDHYSRFNRPLGVFTAHNWRFNRPLLAFQPPTIGVSTDHYWRFKRPLGVSNAHYWRFSTAHYWRFNRPLLAFQTPTIGVSTAHWAFQTPTFLAPILVSTPPLFFLADLRRKEGFQPVKSLYFCVGRKRKKSGLKRTSKKN